MAHFTQLDLSGEPERKPKQESVRKTSGAPHPESHHKMSGPQKTAATVCSLIAMSVLGVSLLETGGCSKTDKPAQISAPSSNTESAITPPAPVPQATSAPMPAVAKKTAKKRVQRKLVASTYSNPVYGITFRYMKPYSLKEGDKANVEWTALSPAQMDFAQPGGTTVSTVELPGRLYPGTDFESAFFNVSVNSKMTEADCGKFAVPETSQSDATSSTGGGSTTPTATSSVEPSKVKLGSAEFTEVENSAKQETKQADAKYYHLFQNGACYEFALGVATKGDGASKGMKALDRNEVFRRLNWMLSTVKIQTAGVPEPATQASGTVGGGKE